MFVSEISARLPPACVMRFFVAILMTLRVISCAAFQARRVTLLAQRLVASLSLEGQALRVTLRLVASLEGQALLVTMLALRLVASLEEQALRVTLLAVRLVACVSGHVPLRLVAGVSGHGALQLACLVAKYRYFVEASCLVVDYCPRYCHCLPTMRIGNGVGEESSENHLLCHEKRTSLVCLLRSRRTVTTAHFSLN